MASTVEKAHTQEWQSAGPSETFAIGEQIGRQLRGGEVLLLDGPLGAGKTVLVKGVAAALDIDPEDITHPSFTLVDPHEGRLPLFHIDLYRLDEGPSAAHAVDLEELLSDERAVIVIEWGATRLGDFPIHAEAFLVTIAGGGVAPRAR